MKKIAITLCAAAIAFSLISCGSKPEPEPENEPEAPVVEKTETPEKEEEPVEEPEIITTPEAEPTVTQIEEVKTVDNTDALNNLDSSRDAALESGAEEYASEELAELDAIYQDIKKRAENGEDVSADCADLQEAYEIVAVYAKVMELKEKIEEDDLAQYCQNVYNEGLKLLDEIDEAEEYSDDVLAKAKEAYTKFNTVCIQGYKALAKQAREDAFLSKKDADSVKAGVARKEKYNEAVDNFKLGDSLYAMQNAEKSIEKYEAAEDIFDELYEELYEARAAAMKAIEEAKKKVAESEKAAELADTEKPLSETEDNDLIEDEDAVLLDEDDYEDPEEAEADIPEELEDDDSAEAEYDETDSNDSEDEEADYDDDSEDGENDSDDEESEDEEEAL